MPDFSFENLIKPSISRIEKYIPGESIDLNRNPKVIKLSSNESPFSIPKKVYSKTQKLILSSNLYPDGASNELKKQLSKTFKLNYKNIVCGNGSDDILSIIAQTFSKEGSEVICSEYGFTYYPIIARAAGCKVVTAKSQELKVSCDNIINCITKRTRIIFIANPNNPTGTYLPREKIVKLMQTISKNIIVVIDGAYVEYVERLDYDKGFSLSEEFDNLILTRTFSKTYGLAALRLGWCYTSKKVANIINKIKPPFNTTSISQLMAIKALEDQEYIEKVVKLNSEIKTWFEKELNKLKIKIKETEGNFSLIETTVDGANKIANHLASDGIIIRRLDSYNMANFIRVSIGTKEEMELTINSLKNFNE